MTPRETCLRESSTSFFMARPMHTHTKGKLCTKLVVPSTGSHIHVGSAVNSSVKPCNAHQHE